MISARLAQLKHRLLNSTHFSSYPLTIIPVPTYIAASSLLFSVSDSGQLQLSSLREQTRLDKFLPSSLIFITTDCENINQNYLHRFDHTSCIKPLFNTGPGMQNIDQYDPTRLSQVRAHTHTHRQSDIVNSDINDMVNPGITGLGAAATVGMLHYLSFTSFVYLPPSPRGRHISAEAAKVWAWTFPTAVPSVHWPREHPRPDAELLLRRFATRETYFRVMRARRCRKDAASAKVYADASKQVGLSIPIVSSLGVT